jgi:O-antigen/teichoic acid export membrane protein
MLREQLKTLGRQAAIYGSADVFRPIVNFLLLPIITRHLTLGEFGILGILLLFGTITKILFRMGLDSGFFRIFYEQETDDQRRKFITTIFLSAVTLSLSLFLLTMLAAESIGNFLLGHGRNFIILVAADTFINAFAFVPMNLFRIQGRSGYFTGVSLFRNALNAALKVTLVVGGWGVAGMLSANVISSTAFVLVLSPTLATSLGKGFSWRMLREAFAFGLPKIPHSIAYQVLNLSDRKLLEWFHSLAESGLYHVAYQFGTGVKFFLSAFELAWSPFVYSLLKRADARETMARIATYAAVIIFGVGLAIAVLGRELLMLMTAPEYHAGQNVIPVIVLAHVFQGLFLLMSIGIGISKKSYYYPVMTFAAATLNVSMNLIVIPEYGRMGAAWSTVAGYGLMTAMGIYFSHKHYPIPFEWGRVGKMGLAAFLCYGISLIAPQSLAPALAVKTVALALFPVGLYVLGFFRPDEIQEIKRVISSRAGPSTPSTPDPH